MPSFNPQNQRHVLVSHVHFSHHFTSHLDAPAMHQGKDLALGIVGTPRLPEHPHQVPEKCPLTECPWLELSADLPDRFLRTLQKCLLRSFPTTCTSSTQQGTDQRRCGWRNKGGCHRRWAAEACTQPTPESWRHASASWRCRFPCRRRRGTAASSCHRRPCAYATWGPGRGGPREACHLSRSVMTDCAEMRVPSPNVAWSEHTPATERRSSWRSHTEIIFFTTYCHKYMQFSNLKCISGATLHYCMWIWKGPSKHISFVFVWLLMWMWMVSSLNTVPALNNSRQWKNEQVRS